MPEASTARNPNPDFPAANTVRWVTPPDTAALRARAEWEAKEQPPPVTASTSPAKPRRITRVVLGGADPAKQKPPAPTSAAPSPRPPRTRQQPAGGPLAGSERRPRHNRQFTAGQTSAEATTTRPRVRYTAREVEAMQHTLEIMKSAMRF